MPVDQADFAEMSMPRHLKVARTLLLMMMIVCTVPGSHGGAPYRMLEEMADDLDAGGSFVEVGSDRGEGSTAWLSSFAARTGRDFFSVDFAPEGFENARRVCGACAYRGLGEDFLSSEFANVSKFGAISFAYLDNYDWIWAGEHVQSYTPQFPAMLSDGELSQYKLKMRKEYEAEGYVLNNGRSQEAHLAQAKLVYSLCTERCIIIFDDTFPLGQGLYSGKGGAAMKFLLEEERFEVVFQSSIDAPSYSGFVAVRRLPGTSVPERNVAEEGGQGAAQVGSLLREEAKEAEEAEEAEEGTVAPVLEWLTPSHGGGVSCCMTTVTLKVTGAVHGLQHLVVFVDHLERFRRADWSNDHSGGDVADLVSFEIPADASRSKKDPGGVDRVVVGAHLLGIRRLQVLANTSLSFHFLAYHEL